MWWLLDEFTQLRFLLMQYRFLFMTVADWHRKVDGSAGDGEGSSSWVSAVAFPLRRDSQAAAWQVGCHVDVKFLFGVCEVASMTAFEDLSFHLRSNYRSTGAVFLFLSTVWFSVLCLEGHLKPFCVWGMKFEEFLLIVLLCFCMWLVLGRILRTITWYSILTCSLPPLLDVLGSRCRWLALRLEKLHMKAGQPFESESCCNWTGAVIAWGYQRCEMGQSGERSEKLVWSDSCCQGNDLATDSLPLLISHRSQLDTNWIIKPLSQYAYSKFST